MHPAFREWSPKLLSVCFGLPDLARCGYNLTNWLITLVNEMKRSASCRVVLSIAPLFVSLALLRAQDSTSGTSAGSAGGAMAVPASQAQVSQVQTSAQNPVFGSVPDAKPTPGVLPLTFSDAIERALRHNLAGLLSEYNTIQARGEKWEQLSALLPNVSADVQEVAEKESLQALGLRSGGPFGNNVPRVIGPFSYFDARISATQRVFDWKSIQKYRASEIGENVAKFNLKDARDLVCLLYTSEHHVGVAVVGAAVSVFTRRAAEFGHRDHDRVFSQIAEVGPEGGDRLREVSQHVGDLALGAAFVDVVVPASYVGEGHLHSQVRFDHLR